MAQPLVRRGPIARRLAVAGDVTGFLDPGGSSGSGPMPLEELSFNYGKIKLSTGHGRGGRYDPNMGRDISPKRCDRPCP